MTDFIANDYAAIAEALRKIKEEENPKPTAEQECSDCDEDGFAWTCS